MSLTAVDYTALLLCGGRSSRMGRDKGLLTYAGQTWAASLYQRLQRSSCERVVLSIRHDQAPEYLRTIPAALVVADETEDQGPIGGMVAAYHRFPCTHLLVIPCDMIRLGASAIEATLTRSREQPDRVVHWRTGDRLHPFPGAYPPEFMAMADQQLKSSTGSGLGILRLIERYEKVSCLEASDPEDFANFNSPEDLREQ